MVVSSHKGKKIEIVNSNNWVDGGLQVQTHSIGLLRVMVLFVILGKPGSYDFTSKLSDYNNIMKNASMLISSLNRLLKNIS